MYCMRVPVLRCVCVCVLRFDGFVCVCVCVFEGFHVGQGVDVSEHVWPFPVCLGARRSFTCNIQYSSFSCDDIVPVTG